ncbi:T9SS type A sorting domain-containing protein [Saccharicrinis aurantiacus]|uniref:T9SS type A sorting domain-containing protein n=1 Tax=Saccharicrinis aurantiacus TaxID=1849719 RepID=UPI002491B838|nr:T9SS type A sorting domain-containing protein [Saccharicrinis aurantiacus]
MKKLLLLTLSAFIMNYALAQTETIYCDFEGDPALTGIQIFKGSGNQTVEQVVNPTSDAVNSSSNVLKAFAPAISGDPAGNKLDAFVFTTGQVVDMSNYTSLKVKILVEGGANSLLKPRAQFGTWTVDAETSELSILNGTFIGVVKNELNVTGVEQDTEGWNEYTFDITAKTTVGDAFQIQIDWQATRNDDLVLYFDDFIFVGDTPTGVNGPEEMEYKVYVSGNSVNVNSELQVNKIEVLSITGRTVKASVGSDLKSINVSDLADGIYIIRTTSGKQVNTTKIMLK